MDSKNVPVLVWENLRQFADEVMRAIPPVVFILDTDADRLHREKKLREDVLSFFDNDDRLFLVYGEEQGCYLARKETLLMALTRVLASTGSTVASFRDCLMFLQTDPFTKGLMRAYNAAGPYPFW